MGIWLNYMLRLWHAWTTAWSFYDDTTTKITTSTPSDDRLAFGRPSTQVFLCFLLFSANASAVQRSALSFVYD